MITAECYNDATYTIRMDKPERHLVSEIAKAYCIPKADAIVAIINRGMDSITGQVQRADEGKTLGELRKEQESEG